MLEKSVDLIDGDSSLLAIPIWIDEHPTLGFLVTDRSDRDIKTYSLNGLRTGSIGRPGYGPGEFSSLTSSFAVDQGVAGYDFATSQVKFFDSRGEYTRALFLDPKEHGQPFLARHVGDGRLLSVRHPVDRSSRRLLAILSESGHTEATFLSLATLFDPAPWTRQVSPLRADGHGDCIFAATSGADSVWVFDSKGRSVAKGVIDEDDRFESLVAHALRRSPEQGLVSPPKDGRYVAHLIALPGCQAAVQVSRYQSSEWRYDHLAPGVVVVIGVAQGEVVALGRQAVPGGLLGRSLSGHPLVVTSPESIDDSYRVLRLTVSSQ